MNVVQFVVRGVSTIYNKTVGKLVANVSEIIVPDALQVNTSIWPGVSKKTYFNLFVFALFSSIPMTWSNRVANRFKLVRIPPLGPSEYCFITSLYFTVSRMS